VADVEGLQHHHGVTPARVGQQRGPHPHGTQLLQHLPGPWIEVASLADQGDLVLAHGVHDGVGVLPRVLAQPRVVVGVGPADEVLDLLHRRFRQPQFREGLQNGSVLYSVPSMSKTAMPKSTISTNSEGSRWSMKVSPTGDGVALKYNRMPWSDR